ncbi:MAG: M20/M25/M40 family metallo-hydrolase, partial [Ignavibacteriaceae bacterium]|nr:M20/M25/M40 family metallo-hydrolase [Ignavibacteriaceae bacterium]
MDTLGEFNIQKEIVNSGHLPYELVVTGLKGGHSGLDIITGRANAIKLLARTLSKLNKVDYKIAKIDGGSLRNAIPREADAVLMLNQKDEKTVTEIISSFETELLNEYKVSDGGLSIKLKKLSGAPTFTFTKKFADNLIELLLVMPHGVIAMSQDIEGLVETSTNLATVKMKDDTILIGTSQRSSIESAKLFINSSVTAAFKLASADKINVGDGYPGWKPNMDSNILKTSKEVFVKLFNKQPEIKAIHAGLECGILGDKYPGLDMVSFGPTIEGAHSPDEKVNVKTVEKFYDLLKGILKNVAESK